MAAGGRRGWGALQVAGEQICDLPFSGCPFSLLWPAQLQAQRNSTYPSQWIFIWLRLSPVGGDSVFPESSSALLLKMVCMPGADLGHCGPVASFPLSDQFQKDSLTEWKSKCSEHGDVCLF